MYKKPPTQRLQSALYSRKRLHVDVLRLDQIHPVVSGNKWYKLKYFLDSATKLGREGILSFGGAYSNHLVALAYASKDAGLKSIGIVRGDEITSNPSIEDMRAAGMDLRFVTRAAYRNKEQLTNEINPGNFYVVPEGGQGPEGVKGATEILSEAPGDYSHVLCSAGTGTMAAGITASASAHQQVIVIPAIKLSSGDNSIEAYITQYARGNSYTVVYDYHFGGFAKYNDVLLKFMDRFFEETEIPTDIVYTGKLFFALNDLVTKDFFPPGSRILVIHSGGLQGNRGRRESGER